MLWQGKKINLKKFRLVWTQLWKLKLGPRFKIWACSTFKLFCSQVCFELVGFSKNRSFTVSSVVGIRRHRIPESAATAPARFPGRRGRRFDDDAPPTFSKKLLFIITDLILVSFMAITLNLSHDGKTILLNKTYPSDHPLNATCPNCLLFFNFLVRGRS